MFSLSFSTVQDKSLVERFFLAKSAERLVEDFVLTGDREAPFDPTMGWDTAASLLFSGTETLADRPLDGELDGDCTLDCISPRTRPSFLLESWIKTCDDCSDALP